jgi:type I restriction enzyme, S subunit
MKTQVTKCLGEVAEFINGRPFKPSDWSTKGIPIIRIQNLTDPSASANCFDGVIEDRYAVKDGDLLVSWSATLNVFVWKRGDAVLNQHIFRVVPDQSQVCSQYLFYALKSVMDELRSKTHGATMKHITKGPFENTRIPVPPIQEQERIVTLLDEADALRRLRAWADRRTADLVPAVFDAFFSDSTTNPLRSSLRPISEVAEVQGGLQLTPIRGTYSLRRPYLRVANVQRGFLVLDEMKDIGLLDNEYDRTRLQKGDLLLVEGNGNPREVGRAAIWDGSIEGCVHQNHLIRVRPQSDMLTPEYLLAFLNSEAGRSYFHSSGNTTSGLVTISTSIVKNCRIPVPPVALQREFSERVAEISRIEGGQSANRRQTENLFQAVLHAAFAGEL